MISDRGALYKLWSRVLRSVNISPYEPGANSICLKEKLAAAVIVATATTATVAATGVATTATAVRAQQITIVTATAAAE